MIAQQVSDDNDAGTGSAASASDSAAQIASAAARAIQEAMNTVKQEQHVLAEREEAVKRQRSKAARFCADSRARRRLRTMIFEQSADPATQQMRIAQMQQLQQSQIRSQARPPPPLPPPPTPPHPHPQPTPLSCFASQQLQNGVDGARATGPIAVQTAQFATPLSYLQTDQAGAARAPFFPDHAGTGLSLQAQLLASHGGASWNPFTSASLPRRLSAHADPPCALLAGLLRHERLRRFPRRRRRPPPPPCPPSARLGSSARSPTAPASSGRRSSSTEVAIPPRPPQWPPRTSRAPAPRAQRRRRRPAPARRPRLRLRRPTRRRATTSRRPRSSRASCRRRAGRPSCPRGAEAFCPAMRLRQLRAHPRKAAFWPHNMHLSTWGTIRWRLSLRAGILRPSSRAQYRKCNVCRAGARAALNFSESYDCGVCECESVRGV